MDSELVGFVAYGIISGIWFIFHKLRPAIKYRSWKKVARKAISDGQTTKCRKCKDHIYPGQWVVRIRDEHTHPGESLAHIGAFSGHYSLKSRNKACFIMGADQKNLGIWNGSQFIPDPNSLQVS